MAAGFCFVKIWNKPTEKKVEDDCQKEKKLCVSVGVEVVAF